MSLFCMFVNPLFCCVAGIPLERLSDIITTLSEEIQDIPMDARFLFWQKDVLFHYYNKVMLGFTYSRWEKNFVNINGTVGGWDMHPIEQTNSQTTRNQKRCFPKSTTEVIDKLLK
jgi:hypothetical protein